MSLILNTGNPAGCKIEVIRQNLSFQALSSVLWLLEFIVYLPLLGYLMPKSAFFNYMVSNNINKHLKTIIASTMYSSYWWYIHTDMVLSIPI